tara:strand:+ start:2449 stop:2565 length:117 start_codon:yes stop_codon:yes gene_type:complete
MNDSTSFVCHFLNQVGIFKKYFIPNDILEKFIIKENVK